MEKEKSCSVKIDYPIRIHYPDKCTCKRIRRRILKYNIITTKIICIIEKIWDDEISNGSPKFICVIKGSDEHTDNKKVVDQIIKNMFKDTNTYESRKYIMCYFKKYDWSKRKSIKIRKMVREITSICFCNDQLLVDMTTCNSGFIIIGDEHQTKCISQCFNENVTKTEFSKLFFVKIGNMFKIDRSTMGFLTQIFMDSNETKSLDKNLYTIVGLESEENTNKTTYSISFGKREWYEDNEETSFECAKRELYEEFNIQFSKILYHRSCKKPNPQYIHCPGIMIYFLYLDENTGISYHKKSDTIYLEPVDNK
ncbi:MAG: putative divergent NUDIX hydrolase [Satyrvirus sp.]|uniref:Putative divergent NUDIX hydrolase n=1 Tax=Satyrvirus sp. TaxID=2487771 RepID=A0A3G5ADY6_9VIRU|nr:MAG: putative divergent NUDIX hydrolase [Satyrvirus sp.]